ncbi:hypothetical protein [Burkholderia vietnamiensis]|uniref:hypothetical protein n=1 Tax=Burkholderia vietnamiensis TaxID=60552 RepID=UPI001B9BC00B|nr:hypothetical protein [Burkholderia vietnamiensis]MBR8151649.1 hypothetical protein [Burkholderia vietnamiensis]MBR8217354.1 hypothetical protein [Burkholderia vietnamiensis]
MPRKIEQKSEAGSFSCVIPDDLREIYADGVSEIQVGMPVSRIIFHSVINPSINNKSEERRANLSLVIPTNQLMELVANIASATSQEVVSSSNAVGLAYAAQLSVQMNRLLKMTEAVAKEEK